MVSYTLANSDGLLRRVGYVLIDMRHALGNQAITLAVQTPGVFLLGARNGAWRLTIRRWSGGVDRRICQTLAASPAEPGELPFWSSTNPAGISCVPMLDDSVIWSTKTN
jgi:hypothetical protein